MKMPQTVASIAELIGLDGSVHRIPQQSCCGYQCCPQPDRTGKMARDMGLSLIDLAFICTQPSDFANALELSTRGWQLKSSGFIFLCSTRTYQKLDKSMLLSVLFKYIVVVYISGQS